MRADEKSAKRKRQPVDPEQELADCREALAAMKQNLQLATADIAKRGLLVKTSVTDSHGKVSKVDRINPSIKIQREAMRAVNNLKKQIAGLDEDQKAREEEKKRAEGRSEFSRFEMAPDENEENEFARN
jgi:hypothetical protein